MAAVGIAVVFSGCTMYSDMKENENPAMETSVMLYGGYISPVFRGVEIADFFAGYQAIREDRDAALELAGLYFGTAFSPDELFYEKFYVQSHGSIEVTGVKDVYRYTAAGLMEERVYQITAAGEGRYIVEGVSSNKGYDEVLRVCQMKAEAVVEDGVVGILGLMADYTENNDLKVVMSCAGTLEMPLCRGGDFWLYPVSGAIRYDISGEVEDSFIVRYHDGNMNMER